MSGSSLIIGTSYYAIAYRFRNTIGITPYVPSGSQFPKERTLPWLAPPFKLIKLYNEGKLQRDTLREAYLKVLSDESFNLNGVIGEIIDRFGVMPVLLGCHKDPQSTRSGGHPPGRLNP